MKETNSVIAARWTGGRDCSRQLLTAATLCGDVRPSDGGSCATGPSKHPPNVESNSATEHQGNLQNAPCRADTVCDIPHHKSMMDLFQSALLLSSNKPASAVQDSLCLWKVLSKTSCISGRLVMLQPEIKGAHIPPAFPCPHTHCTDRYCMFCCASHTCC